MPQNKMAMWPEGEGPLTALIETLREMFNSLMRTVPIILVWLLALVVGWLIFKYLAKGLTALLEKSGFDGLAERIGVAPALGKMGIKASPSKLLGTVVFVLLILQFILISSDRFGLDWLTAPLKSIVDYLPNAITAFIILLVGSIVAELIRNALFAAAERMGLDYAKSVSTLAFGFMLLLVIILAVRELGIETSLLEDTVKIAMVGVALAIGIALGLGLHQLARNIVAGVYARDLFPEGAKIDFDGENSDVVGVGSVNTKIRKADGSFVLIPNVQIVGEVTRGRDPE